MGAREILNILVIIFCAIAIIISIYDLYRLNNVHNNAINKCNEFYHKEFAAKCVPADPFNAKGKPYIDSLNFTLEFK